MEQELLWWLIALLIFITVSAEGFTLVKYVIIIIIIIIIIIVNTYFLITG